jgi:hypothetical protein
MLSPTTLRRAGHLRAHRALKAHTFPRGLARSLPLVAAEHIVKSHHAL